MPYTKAYAGGWQNGSAGSTPIDAAALNTMENGIQTAFDNFQIQATAPSSPSTGQIWYDSTTGTLREWNGSTWRMVASPSATNGGVLQIIQTAKSDVFASSVIGFTDVTGLAASITPKSTSSKVLVFVDVKTAPAPSASVVTVRLLRNSTVIYAGDSAGIRPLGFGQVYGGNTGSDGSYYTVPSQTAMFLDSPASTSSTTYKVQILAEGGTVYVNRTNQDRNGTYSDARVASSVTLMEIAA